MDAAEAAPVPDVALLDRLRAGMIARAEVRGQLDPTDHAAVDEVIRHYYALADELSAASRGTEGFGPGSGARACFYWSMACCPT